VKTIAVGISPTVGVTAVADRVEVARAVIEAFARRDGDRLLTLFTPDAEFWTRVLVLSDPHFKGHDAVRAWLGAVDEKYDRYEILDVEYLSGAGDSVVVSCRLSLRYRGDSHGMSRSVHWVMHVDEGVGQLRLFTSYRDRAEALDAAGLPP
jgi:ketosteroid isomerase-like protein